MSTSLPGTPTRWTVISSALVRAFHVYAAWLVSISWKRFFALALLLMISLSILSELPPFRWTISQTVSERPVKVKVDEKAKGAPSEISIETGKDKSDNGVEVSIGPHGVRISKSRAPAAAASAAASAAAAAQAAAETADKAAATARDSLVIKVPPGTASKAMNEAIEEARREILAEVEEARQEAQDAADAAKRDAEEASADAARATSTPVRRVHKVSLGDFLIDVGLFWIVASIMIKITYKGRIQAEVKAARATETAEAESLKRQVAEARMAALQAQVEPHFLFNTLAAIDHLIETDPPRASTMQKNLITYLRSTLQQMRESATTLGREVDLVAAYLEILKVRMEERLDVRIEVAQGLRSAVFPPMMLQTLVENAVKHGLEPSCDAATLTVKAEVMDGALRVSVADTGVGYDPARSTPHGPGLGLGLANIRERLEMMYGARAGFEIGPLLPHGTLATITLPYAVRSASAAVAEPSLPARVAPAGGTMSA